jgi:hypothetical protein
MEVQPTPTQNPEIKLDRKSKLLFAAIGLLIAASVAVTYWRYMAKRDYIVQAQTDCDPETENCFIWKCDPASDVEGEACTGDPEKDIWYYKIVRRNAKNIPLCDPNNEECTALVCSEGEADCSEQLCTAENVPEGETCNDPQQYLLDNPPEEESEECAPDDQECLAAQEESAEECAPDDQECLDAQATDATEETCAPDDKECAAQSGTETNLDNSGVQN